MQIKTIFKTIFLFVAFMATVPVFATDYSQNATVQQGITVTGTVIDDTGESLPGVNIVVKGTSIGQITDTNGKYTITVPNREAILLFSFVGYVTQEIPVGNNLIIDVQLNEDAQLIDEVVVVGYGVQKKENLTGSVTVVNMEKVLGSRPISNVGSALQGAVPGLQITGGASPGAGKDFNIRGITSITGGNPLILVDNVETQINLVNPEDIETVTVLKDAASSAIYGARAAFGVILITTKKAKKNTKMTFNYNNNFAFAKAVNQIEEASVKDVVSLLNEWSPGGSYYLSGQPFELWLNYIESYQANPKAFGDNAIANGEYFNTRWGMYSPKTGAGVGRYFYLKDNYPKNEILDNFGFQQTHNISASGGGDKIAYRLSLGYIDNDGPLKFDKDTYRRVNISSYVSADLTSWLNTAFDIRYAAGSRVTQEDIFGGEIYNLNYANFMPGADSWAAATNLDGPVYLTRSPLNFIIHGSADEIRNEQPRIFSRTTFTPIKGFEGIFEYTYDENVYDRKRYTNSIVTHDGQMIANPYGDPTFRRDKTTARYTSTNVYGTYSLSVLNKHNFKLMAGFSQEQRYYESLWVSRKEAINPDQPSITGSEGEILSADDYTDYTIRSGFYRFNYNYDSKYLLEVNGRYDGSSRFPTKNRFGFFPSASAGWQIAREGFMEWSKSWLNEFKIRGSWGEIGNQAIGNYEFIPAMSVQQRASWIYAGRRPTTLNPPPMVRDNFTWERVVTLGFGTDISMLNNRLQVTFDWYQRDTKDMLGPGDELPAVVGARAPTQNIADLQTKGFELAANWRDHIGEWGYSIGFNLYDYRSKITKFNNDRGLFYNRNSAQGDKRYYVGHEFGEIWGRQFERFYSVDDFENTTSWTLKPGITSIRGVNPLPGDVMWKNLDDQTGTNEINDGASNLDDPGDRTIIGNETLRYQFGATASVNYKGFDLSIFVQGVGKSDVWLGGTMVFPGGGGNSGQMYQHQVGDYMQVKDVANGDYTFVNPNAFYPRIYNQPANEVNNSNRYVSDRYMLDRSYLRVKNITLSYTFPQNLVQTIGLENARIFFSAENVFTFSNLIKGIDPERISWGYPFYATYSFGINISL